MGTGVTAAAAAALVERGLATLLVDLLTEGEAADRDRVFDIGLLARRLATALQWAASDPETRDLPVGPFGASMGAAAALRCAALERLRDGKLEIVPDASHLFEEPGALEDVARRAGDFVLKHLARRDRGAAA